MFKKIFVATAALILFPTATLAAGPSDVSPIDFVPQPLPPIIYPLPKPIPYPFPIPRIEHYTATPSHPVTLNKYGQQEAKGKGSVTISAASGVFTIEGKGSITIKDGSLNSNSGFKEIGHRRGWHFYRGKGTFTSSGNLEVRFVGAGKTYFNGSGKVTYRGNWEITFSSFWCYLCPILDTNNN